MGSRRQQHRMQLPQLAILLPWRSAERLLYVNTTVPRLPPVRNYSWCQEGCARWDISGRLGGKECKWIWDIEQGEDDDDDCDDKDRMEGSFVASLLCRRKAKFVVMALYITFPKNELCAVAKRSNRPILDLEGGRSNLNSWSFLHAWIINGRCHGDQGHSKIVQIRCSNFGFMWLIM